MECQVDVPITVPRPQQSDRIDKGLACASVSHDSPIIDFKHLQSHTETAFVPWECCTNSTGTVTIILIGEIGRDFRRTKSRRRKAKSYLNNNACLRLFCERQGTVALAWLLFSLSKG